MDGPRRNPHPQLQRRLCRRKSEPSPASGAHPCGDPPCVSTPGPREGRTHPHSCRRVFGGARPANAFSQEDSELWKCRSSAVKAEGPASGARGCGATGPSEPRRWAAERTGHEPPCRLGLGSVQQEATAGARWACAGPALLVLPIWLRGEHGEQGDPGPGPAAGPLLSQRGHSRPFCVSWAPSEPSFPKTSSSPGSAARWVDDICGAQASSHPHSQGLHVPECLV